jgi:hypothetical protein
MPTVIYAGETFPQPSVNGQGDLPLPTVICAGETFPQPSE